MQASNDSIWRQDHFEDGDKVEGVGGVDHDVGDVVDDVEDVADVDVGVVHLPPCRPPCLTP